MDEIFFFCTSPYLVSWILNFRPNDLHFYFPGLGRRNIWEESKRSSTEDNNLETWIPVWFKRHNRRGWTESTWPWSHYPFCLVQMWQLPTNGFNEREPVLWHVTRTVHFYIRGGSCFAVSINFISGCLCMMYLLFYCLIFIIQCTLQISRYVQVTIVYRFSW